MLFILFYRNQAYQAHIQLAVLDNNSQCLRDPACNKEVLQFMPVSTENKVKSGMSLLSRKGRNIPMTEIVEEIEKHRHNSSHLLKKK